MSPNLFLLCCSSSLKDIHTHSLALILKCNNHAHSLSLSVPPSQPPSLLTLTPSPTSSLEQLHRSQPYIFQPNCLRGTDLPKTLQELLPISVPENRDLLIGPQRPILGGHSPLPSPSLLWLSYDPTSRSWILAPLKLHFSLLETFSMMFFFFLFFSWPTPSGWVCFLCVTFSDCASAPCLPPLPPPPLCGLHNT